MKSPRFQINSLILISLILLSLSGAGCSNTPSPVNNEGGGGTGGPNKPNGPNGPSGKPGDKSEIPELPSDTASSDSSDSDDSDFRPGGPPSPRSEDYTSETVSSPSTPRLQVTHEAGETTVTPRTPIAQAQTQTQAQTQAQNEELPRLEVSFDGSEPSTEVASVQNSPRLPNTPRVQTPGVETPRVQTPRAETPRVQTPDTPRAETPPNADLLQTQVAPAAQPNPSPEVVQRLAGTLAELLTDRPQPQTPRMPVPADGNLHPDDANQIGRPENLTNAVGLIHPIGNVHRLTEVERQAPRGAGTAAHEIWRQTMGDDLHGRRGTEAALYPNTDHLFEGMMTALERANTWTDTPHNDVRPLPENIGNIGLRLAETDFDLAQPPTEIQTAQNTLPEPPTETPTQLPAEAQAEDETQTEDLAPLAETQADANTTGDIVATNDETVAANDGIEITPNEVNAQLEAEQAGLVVEGQPVPAMLSLDEQRNDRVYYDFSVDHPHSAHTPLFRFIGGRQLIAQIHTTDDVKHIMHLDPTVNPAPRDLVHHVNHQREFTREVKRLPILFTNGFASLYEYLHRRESPDHGSHFLHNAAYGAEEAALDRFWLFKRYEAQVDRLLRRVNHNDPHFDILRSKVLALAFLLDTRQIGLPNNAMAQVGARRRQAEANFRNIVRGGQYRVTAHDATRGMQHFEANRNLEGFGILRINDAILRGLTMQPGEPNTIPVEQVSERIRQFFREGINPYGRGGTRTILHNRIREFDPTVWENRHP